MARPRAPRSWRRSSSTPAATPGFSSVACRTPLEGFAREPRTDALWSARAVHGVQDFSRFELLEGGQPRGTVQWSLIGAHNVENALAAIAAARHVGVEVKQALDALQAFQGIARRLQLY